MNHSFETEQDLEYRIKLIMQSNSNLIRTYKQKDKDVRVDPKRNKFNDKDKRKLDRNRKLKERELE